MSDFVDYRAEFSAYEADYPMREVQLEGGSFRCIVAGPESAAHTLVFLNGGMNSYEMWLRYVKDLSRDYRVLSFDYPEAYETDQALLDGMHELFAKLSISRVVLVGASMGGIIAQLYARAQISAGRGGNVPHVDGGADGRRDEEVRQAAGASGH